ncbi:hypothetical protein B566_EDAN010199, partial [Ephemera danica]
MEDSDITALSSGNADEALRVLQVFNKKNSQTFSFSDLNKENKRKRLWEAIFLRLNNPSSEECYIDCLVCLRLLRARVRNEMKGMKYLTEALENLLPAPEASNDVSVKLNDDQCVLVCELLKILFNLVDGSQNQPTDEEEEA